MASQMETLLPAEAGTSLATGSDVGQTIHNLENQLSMALQVDIATYALLYISAWFFDWDVA